MTVCPRSNEKDMSGRRARIRRLFADGKSRRLRHAE
jgi:hypothetical protein